MYVSCLICLLSTASPQDSVLVRVAGTREITLSQGIRSWREAHQASPVDSITPQGVQGFLDLLTDAAILTEAAVRSAPPWSPEDSSAHRSLRDRLVLAAALDSVLRATRAASPTDSGDASALGALARDRLAAGLAPAYDDSACAWLARAFASLPKPSADSSLGAQLRVLQRLPHLAGRDSAVVLARTSAGDVRAGEVVAAWARLGVAYRPRIETPAQVRDLVANQLFERRLRAATASGRFDRDPGVMAALAADAELHWRERFLEREVFGSLVVDSAAVEAYWNAHGAEWALPRRVRGIRLELDDRAAAVRMGATLADAANAEGLASRAAARGVNYRFEVGARDDSSLFRRALAAGAGGLVGPVAQDGSWWVARVSEIRPARSRTLEEVREAVTGRCYAAEAEQRTRALISRLRGTMRVEPRPRAAERLRSALLEATRRDAVSAGP